VYLESLYETGNLNEAKDGYDDLLKEPRTLRERHYRL
jgi:hypothetical protein